MTCVEVEDLQTMVAAIDGLRIHLDLFTHNVTLELERIQLKLNRILREVEPPAPLTVSIST